MSHHSDTLFWLRANQSLLLLLNVACLAETQHIPILYSLVWPDRGSNPQYIALDASTLTITLPMQFPTFILFYLLFNRNFLVSYSILFENKNESKTIRVTWYLYKMMFSQTPYTSNNDKVSGFVWFHIIFNRIQIFCFKKINSTAWC